MAIPKVIYQTYKDDKLPLGFRYYIERFRKKNPTYRYEFFDDQRVDAFIKDNFTERTYRAFKKLQIGAAKADFFRYAILYRLGGVYLDLDSDILVNLDDVIRDDDVALIAREKTNPHLFAQWALIYEANHPFLKRTLHYMIDHIEHGRYPHNVHAATGPTVYSIAINRELQLNPTTEHRIAPNNYTGIMRFKHLAARLYFAFQKKDHWRSQQMEKGLYMD